MSRGIIPFILALVALVTISIAGVIPLFEWQINEVISDSPEYDTDMFSSLWTASLGESLTEQQYIYRHLVVFKNDTSCAVDDLHMVVHRSQKDELWEQLLLTRAWTNESKHWTKAWLLIEIVLTVIYGLWFINWYEHRPSSHVTIFAVLVILGTCLILMPALKLLVPLIGFFTGNVHCETTIVIDATLSKVNYWVPILFFTGIFAEVAALVVMRRNILEAITKRKESSKSAVG